MASVVCRRVAWWACVAALCVVLAGGGRVRAYGDAPGKQYVAPRLPQSPKIDGKLD